MLSTHLVVRQAFFHRYVYAAPKKVSKMPCAVVSIILNNKKLHAILCKETITLSLCHTIKEKKYLPYTFDTIFYNPNASLYNILPSLFCICDNI